jgi:hypothetical protein
MVWMSFKLPGGSIFDRNWRTKTSSVLLSTSRSLPQTASSRRSRVTARPALAHESLQEREFGARQENTRFSAPDGALRGIEYEIGDLQARLGLHFFAPRQRLKTSSENLERKRRFTTTFSLRPRGSFIGTCTGMERPPT